MATRMLQRRGTAAEWAAQNPILSPGEIGIELDTQIIKTGDGVTPWSDLPMPYLGTGGGQMTGPLTLQEPTAANHAARLTDVTNVPVGGIIMYSGALVNLSSRWRLCDGANGTPDLRGRFIVGAEGSYNQGDTGGANNVTLTAAQMPSHTHTGPSHTHASGTLANNSTGAHTHSSGTLSTGSTGAHVHSLFMRRLSGGSSYNNTHTHMTSVGDYGDNAASLFPDSNNNTTASSTRSGSNSPIGSTGSHSHSVSGSTASNGAHAHTISGNTAASGTANTGSAGSGNSHENRPPYYALAFIMRVA